MLKCLILLASISMSSFAAIDFLEMDAKEDGAFTVKRSKWLIDFGLRYINYETTFAPFQGEHKSISSTDTISTYNVNLGLGREFYIGGGLSLSIKASGYFSDNDFEEAGNAAEDIDYQVSSYREKSRIIGQEASASLNYLFENRTIHVQPFFEFALGRGDATISKIYDDKGVTSDPAKPEDYPASNYTYEAREKFTYSSIGLGVNFLSNYNLNSYIKVTQYSIELDERTIERLESSATITAPGESGVTQFLSASTGLTYTF